MLREPQLTSLTSTSCSSSGGGGESESVLARAIIGLVCLEEVRSSGSSSRSESSDENSVVRRGVARREREDVVELRDRELEPLWRWW